VLPGATSPWQCAQVSTGSVTFPQVSWTSTTTALQRLMEQYQQLDPFRFLIYAELAGTETGPAQ
jgi:hypothetical protein